MARGARRALPLPAPVNSVIASAARLIPSTGSIRPNRPTNSQEWQGEAWYFYDTVGELSFAANWFANALSRVRLYPQQEDVDGDHEIDSGPAKDALDAIGSEGARAQTLASIGLHMFVPGECYLVGATDATTNEDKWEVLSTDEVKQQGTSSLWAIDRGDGNRQVIDTDPESEDPGVVIRIWRSHPRLWVEATSPVRAVIPVLRELEGLTKHIAATIDSRLAGAGVLAVPAEMTFGSPAPPPATPEGPQPEGMMSTLDPEVDKFLSDLTEAMLTPMRDRGNAAAVVPVVIKAPGALLGNIRHITFATPLDEKAMDLRSECIRRLALGLDMPPEVLLGTGDVNHWGAWQVEEAAIKTHIEPMCEIICTALTERYLVPVLEGQGLDTEGISVAADTSDLRLRPNRSTEAFEMYDRWVINTDALLRETGFEPGDKPEPAELRQQVLTTIARASITPELAAAAMAALGVQLTPAPATTDEVSSGTTASTPTTPAVPVPDLENRQGPPEQAAALLAAAEPLVGRAVERVRNRVAGRGKRPAPMPADVAMDNLRREFDPALIARTADRLCVDAPEFGRALATAALEQLVAGEADVHVSALAGLLAEVPARRRLHVAAAVHRD